METFKQQLIDRMLKIGNYGLSIQSSDGSMPSGRNGPHQHRMTPVRNTGHWSVLFSKLYLQTGDSRWEEATRKSIDLIIDKKYHPLKGAFWERKEAYRSSTNGLIGQAWTLEAIHSAGAALNETRYLEVAERVVKLHPFDWERYLWQEIDLAGVPQDVGATLNQQIWFTAQALTILPDKEKKEEATAFLDHLPENSRIRKSGLFYTGIYFPSRGRFQKMGQLRKAVKQSLKADNRLEIDAGYHIFTLLGLALLSRQLPAHPYFQRRDVVKSLCYAFSKEYEELLEDNRYGYPYNVPGLELPIVWETFENLIPKDSIELTVNAFKKQLREYYSYTDKPRGVPVCDADTLMARFYEITRLGNGFVKVMEEKKKYDENTLFGVDAQT